MMLLRVLCAFLWCKLELIDFLLSRGSPPAESAQNARPDPTHASDCARGDIARIWRVPRASPNLTSLAHIAEDLGLLQPQS